MVFLSTYVLKESCFHFFNDHHWVTDGDFKANVQILAITHYLCDFGQNISEIYASEMFGLLLI